MKENNVSTKSLNFRNLQADLTAFCGIDPQTNQQYVNQVNQKAGDIVKPRPGQLHYVHNTQPCIKVAFDHFVPEHARAYLQAWRELSSKYTSNAQDYSSFQVIMCEAATRYATEYRLV